MSLFKTAIVVSAVIALLPSDKGRQQQLYAQAVAAVEHGAGYCERNPETCARASGMWQQFKDKAAFAGELAAEAVQRYAAGTPSDETEASLQPASAVPRRSTLTAQDRETEWRGSKRRPGI